jgi:hypothetical protein
MEQYLPVKQTLSVPLPFIIFIRIRKYSLLFCQYAVLLMKKNEDTIENEDKNYESLFQNENIFL